MDSFILLWRSPKQSKTFDVGPMRRDKLHSIRTDTKYRLFSKAEVAGRKRV